MIQAWQTFLSQQGAQLENGYVVSFASNPAFPDNSLCPLGSWHLLRISGADAETFMQGQFSNDVRLLDGQNSQLSSYNSAKGRMYSCFRLLKNADVYFLRLPADIADAVIKRLRMFVLRSQVVIEDVSEQYVHLGLVGEKTAKALRQAGLTAPDAINGISEKQGTLCLHLPGAVPRYELFVPADKAQPLWNSLCASLTPANENRWELAEIRSGQPEVYQATLEAFVPQMANLDLIGGISFNKGCYTGQEIVARTHYLGKQKKRMYLLSTYGTDVNIGDKLFEHASDNTQSIGEVVRKARNEHDGYDFLAVMQIKSTLADLRLLDVNGESCDVEQQPYTIPGGDDTEKGS